MTCGAARYARHCVRAAEEMDSKTSGLCPQKFASPRCRCQIDPTSGRLQQGAFDIASVRVSQQSLPQHPAVAAMAWNGCWGDIGKREEDNGCKQQIVNGEQEVDNGKREEDNGCKQALANGEQKVNNGKQGVDNGQQEGHNGEQEVNDGKQEVDDGKQQVKNGMGEGGNGKQEVDNGKEEVDMASSRAATASKTSTMASNVAVTVGPIDLIGYHRKPPGRINATWRWLTESLLAVRMARLLGELRAIQAVHIINIVDNGRAMRMIEYQRM